jgi:hypothetical protein
MGEPRWPARLVARVAARLWRGRADLDYTSPDAYARLCEDLRIHPGEAEEREEFARAQACAGLVGTGDQAWWPEWEPSGSRWSRQTASAMRELQLAAERAYAAGHFRGRERCLAAGIPTDRVDALLADVRQSGLDLDHVLKALARGGPGAT